MPILISDCITLQDYPDRGEVVVELDENMLFICTFYDDSTVRYSLDKLPVQLTVEERLLVLDGSYGAGNYDENEAVTVGDIFRCNTFITQVH